MQQVVEQEEQLEQSAKVIRYLQGQLQQPHGGSTSKEQLLLEQLEATQDECDELRGQVGGLSQEGLPIRGGVSAPTCRLLLVVSIHANKP